MAQLLFSGSDICESMLADIQAAKRHIKLEQYIVFDDENGRRFLQLLREKAAAGVSMDLLFDAVGCRDIRNSAALVEIARQGGHVRFYNRIHWGNLLTPNRWFPRNHAKVMVVDDRLLHIGSACFADYMTGWREAHARLEGTIVRDMGQDMITDGDSDDAHPHFRHMSTHPGRRNAIYRELIGRIDTAQKSLFLATPYFTPPVLLQHAIRRALRRGVDVRLLTGEKTDVPIARIVGQTYFRKFLRRGARIFLYKPDVMHAKYVIVDGEWGMVGSVNLDYLSLLRNREATLCVEDKKTLAVLTAQFERDCSADSREIGRHFWRAVPWYEKILGYLGRGMKKVL
jgi:cardiolipin synthase